MGMYENLQRLKLPDVPDSGLSQALSDGSLMQFCAEEAVMLNVGAPGRIQQECAASIHHGILLGLGYAGAFGIPDVAKNLYAVR